MAVEIDPITGLKKISYTNSQTEYTTARKENRFMYGLTGAEKYSGKDASSRTLWDATNTGSTILGSSNMLSTTGDSSVLGALQSSDGQKLMEFNPEFAAYYKAFLGEEMQRKNLGKIFGVSNTVLGSSGATGVDSSKKGTILGG